MARIESLSYDDAIGRTKELFEGIQSKLGMVPNLYRAIGQSPVALEAMLGLNSALEKSPINAKAREQIAVAVANQNECPYCLSAHTAIGKMLGVTEKEIDDNRFGRATDSRIQSILDFALEVNSTRGFVTDDSLAKARAAGLTEAELLDIIAIVVLNIWTNYTHHVTESEIEFPLVSPENPVAV